MFYEVWNVDRRKSARWHLPELWITELDGDYRFSLQAANLSPGGVFLLGRMMDASPREVLLRIPIGDFKYIEVRALPLYDRKIKTGFYGTGYKFVELTRSERKTILALIERENKRKVIPFRARSLQTLNQPEI